VHFLGRIELVHPYLNVQIKMDADYSVNLSYWCLFSHHPIQSNEAMLLDVCRRHRNFTRSYKHITIEIKCKIYVWRLLISEISLVCNRRSMF
jgi:hypothetical protein